MNMLSASLTLALFLAAGSPAGAQDMGQFPVAVTFVISAGFWQDSGPDMTTGEAGSDQDEQRRGYYKLVSVRQPDATAKIYLQQIQSTQDGPSLINSVELEEFSALGAYVTDIRPEDSRGVSSQPGLFATVYLKTDPQSSEPESWTVIIDEFGDITVERATN